MPTTKNWQLQKPIHAIVFDCDGTLSAIEGIDELAHQNGVGAAVAALTAKAMGKSGINPDLYRQRLQLAMPNQKQVMNLADLYRQHIAPDAEDVIHILQRLNKKVFIVSAGLRPAVKLFGASLQVPENQVFAVDVLFDPHGRYLDFDRESPLTVSNGKRLIAQSLLRQYDTVAHIGDGMNDFIVHDLVTRFIGYGGMYYRANIEEQCDFYIKQKSLAGCLPLLLTKAEAEGLTGAEKALYERGIYEIT